MRDAPLSFTSGVHAGMPIPLSAGTVHTRVGDRHTPLGVIPQAVTLGSVDGQTASVADNNILHDCHRNCSPCRPMHRAGVGLGWTHTHAHTPTLIYM
jgi:hypothetical protein